MDDRRDAPPSVVWSVAAGVAPLPFLGVYAVLFIARGTVRPVIPPDIGSSKGDELIAGIVALLLFVLVGLGALWLLDGRRRWLFAIGQLIVLGGCCFLISDSTSGSPSIPILLVLTTVLALVLAFAPASWDHVHQRAPGWLVRRRTPTVTPADAPPTVPVDAPVPPSDFPVSN